MTRPLTLLQVHAHPDDESSKGAGTNALYHARGVRTILVCCTGGEEGDILNENFGAMTRPILDIRRDELSLATAILGYDRVHYLGYEDSGMAEGRANENPACFARAPLRHATGRLAKILRAERPDVMLIYAEDGGYPHPDHLAVHTVGLAAWEASGSDDYRCAGEPFTVPKLYYHARSKAGLIARAEAYERLGLEAPFRQWIRDEDDDSHLTTQVEVGAFMEQRQRALLAHATQVAPDGWWMKLPLETAREAYPYEDYTLARHAPHVEVRLPETDLFAGLPG